MALRAHGIPHRAHVMGRVAVLASLVGGYARRSENVNVLMAGAAGRRSAFGEIVRAVAADTFLVTFGEERRCWHLGLRRRMACGARGESLRGRRVRMSMARDARLAGLFAPGCVRSRDLLMAFRTRSDGSFDVLVGAVTRHALAGAVHLDGRRVLLLGRVTTLAIIRRRDVRGHARFGARVATRARDTGVRVPGGQRTETGMNRLVHGERVARGAIGARLWPEACLGLLLRVIEMRFLLVTLRAARGSDRAHRVGSNLVTAGAGDLLARHVHAVIVDRSGRLPDEGDVDALSGVTRGSRVDIGRACCQRGKEDCHEENECRGRAMRRHDRRAHHKSSAAVRNALVKRTRSERLPWAGFDPKIRAP